MMGVQLCPLKAKDVHVPYFKTPLRQALVDLQRRHMRSPAQAL